MYTVLCILQSGPSVSYSAERNVNMMLMPMTAMSMLKNDLPVVPQGKHQEVCLVLHC